MNECCAQDLHECWPCQPRVSSEGDDVLAGQDYEVIIINQNNKMTDMSTETANTMSTSVKIDRSVYVYYSPKPTIRVNLKFSKEEVGEMSLLDLVQKSIRTLNEQYNLPINMSRSAYSVYPANKTGSKREGYPELDTKLAVCKINMRRFYLEEVNKAFSLISTEFNLERKYGLQKKVSQDVMGCCSIFRFSKS